MIYDVYVMLYVTDSVRYAVGYNLSPVFLAYICLHFGK